MQCNNTRSPLIFHVTNKDVIDFIFKVISNLGNISSTYLYIIICLCCNWQAVALTKLNVKSLTIHQDLLGSQQQSYDQPFSLYLSCHVQTMQ